MTMQSKKAVQSSLAQNSSHFAHDSPPVSALEAGCVIVVHEKVTA